MTREEREALSQLVCNFYYGFAEKSVKTTVNYSEKQDVPQSTIYYVLKKYLQHGTTKYLSRSRLPLELSKNLNNIVKPINNRRALSQRQIARQFKVRYLTISRTLRRRTSIVIRKRRRAPKTDNEQQQVRARKN